MSKCCKLRDPGGRIDSFQEINLGVPRGPQEEKFDLPRDAQE